MHNGDTNQCLVSRHFLFFRIFCMNVFSSFCFGCFEFWRRLVTYMHNPFPVLIFLNFPNFPEFSRILEFSHKLQSVQLVKKRTTSQWCCSCEIQQKNMAATCCEIVSTQGQPVIAQVCPTHVHGARAQQGNRLGRNTLFY